MLGQLFHWECLWVSSLYLRLLFYFPGSGLKDIPMNQNGWLCVFFADFFFSSYLCGFAVLTCLFFNYFIQNKMLRYGWAAAGVNHVLIFEVDPRNHLTYQMVL